MLVQLYWFCVGFAWPHDHENGPFSCSKPSSDEQPGPPFVLRARVNAMCTAREGRAHQKTRSSRLPSGPGGKNQKKSSRVSPVLLLIGSKPDQLGPTSQSTSGMLFPST
jgi:hypothetical protein